MDNFVNYEEIGEREWIAFASKNDGFDFLSDPSEDIYTDDDGDKYQDVKK